MGKKEERKGLTETAIDTTINIHKLAHRETFKKKAPRAITHIRTLVAKMMRTTDVRIDPKLNQALWVQGVRNLPRRIRVRISRKRNEDDSKAGNEWYSLVQHVNVEDFHGKLTQKAKVSAWSPYLNPTYNIYHGLLAHLSQSALHRCCQRYKDNQNEQPTHV